MSEPTGRDIVWEGTVDAGTWIVRVVSDSADGATARLEILDGATKTIRFSEPTALSYGAMFGADASDIHEWQDRAISWIDSQSDES